jgi:hypothetical protein
MGILTRITVNLTEIFLSVLLLSHLRQWSCRLRQWVYLNYIKALEIGIGFMHGESKVKCDRFR